MDFDTNPMDEDRELPSRSRAPREMATSSSSIKLIECLAHKQAPYFTMISQFQDLFYKLPEITPAQVDERMKELYETFMKACESVGISRMSIPPLKECCGRKRVVRAVTVEAPAQGLRLGDKVAWVLDKLGFKKCEACRKRQEALNKIRLPGSK